MSELIYQQAHTLAQTHYENFPVIPFFLPKKWQKPIALIYAFARQADDIADEGEDTPAQRRKKLTRMHALLPDQTASPSDPFFDTLNAMIVQHALPVSLFHDLLKAFEQDVEKKTYQTFDDLLAYCQCSANPVGRLLLHLTHQDTQENLKASDDICTALQLINFLQDLEDDLQNRQRLYIPLKDLERYSLSIEDLKHQRHTSNVDECLQLQWQRAYDLLQRGKPLGRRLKGLFGYDIRLTIAGGACILKKLQTRPSPFQRPILKWHDWPQVALKAI